MISISDVRKSFNSKNDDDAPFHYRLDEHDNIINTETNKVICDIATFTEYLRKELHCDFEMIYYCHGTLQTVYRCKECGAVIFASDDCYYYEDDLRCPVCSDYQTGFEYWTAEEIAQDKKKQNTIDMLCEMQREQVEADKRYMKRHKYDSEIWKGRIKLFCRRAIFIDLKCENLFKSGLKGLRLEFHWGVQEKDSIGYTLTKRFVLPLSFSALKISLYCAYHKNELIKSK